MINTGAGKTSIVVIIVKIATAFDGNLVYVK